MKSKLSLYILSPIIFPSLLFLIVRVNIRYLMGLSRVYVDFWKPSSDKSIIIFTLGFFFWGAGMIYDDLWKKGLLSITIFPDRIVFKRPFSSPKTYYKEEITKITRGEYQTRMFSVPNAYLKLRTKDNKSYIIAALYIKNFKKLDEFLRQEWAEKMPKTE